MNYQDPDEWLTGQICKLCHITKPTLLRHARAGRIPRPEVRGNRHIWTRSQVEEIVAYYRACIAESERRLTDQMCTDKHVYARCIAD